ncbi:hepatocyte growth factor receptor-like [Rhipicephalus sanguineus]|uniref:hepatocyte growth factor receptor-like n=1 Tax=Rhipicephalus sanguineus TaxID=34632 RepID=UPI0020C51DD7|nr:hepatocyte growth factor receptor-like [Rhipicephalus sanguineus]
MCSVHQSLDDLKVAKPMDNGSAINYVASRLSTVAFLGTSTNKSVLFVASTYDDRPLEYHPYAVSRRVLDESNLTFEVGSSFVNIADSKKKQRNKIRYVHGFSHKGFAYFVAVQKKPRIPMPPETRLARVCESDDSFRTYTEILITCAHDGKQQYMNASSAAYGPYTSEYSGDGKVLLVAFAPNNGNQGKSNRSKFALCLFDMDRVEEEFRKTTENCNDGKQEASRLSRLFSNGTELTIGTTVAWVGDRKGNLHKYVILDQSLKSKPLWTFRIAPDPIEKATAVDRDGSHGYFLAGNSVIRFPIGSCIVYEDCSDCLQKSDDPLQCGWCEDRCAHSCECPKGKKFVSNRCPIIVSEMLPKKGPTAGGTLLDIRGKNFASVPYNQDKSMNVTVGGQLCDYKGWSEDRITCKTPPGQNDSTVDIIISVNDVATNEFRKYDVFDHHVITAGFEYKDPTLRGIFPNHGPIAGGTSVILHGTDLDSGSKRKVTIGPTECQIKGFKDTFLECITSPVNSSFVNQSFQVKLTTDDFEVPFTLGNGSGFTFTYKLDPVIESIVPGEASVSEEPIINVTGTNLDSVATPMMVTQVSSVRQSDKPEEIKKACVVASGGQQMTCSGPLLTEFSGLNATELQAHDKPITAHISFKMDGLLLPRPMNGSPGYFPFNYRLELWVDRFPDEGIGVDFWHPVVKIGGKLFDVLINSTLLSIRVDSVDGACNVTKIKYDRIVCTLTSSSWDDDLPHQLDVVYGNRVYPVGSIKLVKLVEKKPVSWSYHGAIAGIIVAVLIVFFIGVGLALYWRFRVNKTKPPAYFVDFENRNVGNRASNGGDSPRYQETIPGATRQGVGKAAFQMDEETKAILEADKLLFNRELVVLGPVVGQGHFGCVYRGTLELQGKDEVLRVAIKTLHNNSRGGDSDSQQFLKEALIMKDFNHENVLPLIGLCLDERDGLMVITPYMKYGDLHSYLRNENNSPTLRDLITFGIHVAKGMEYLAHLKFVHRDLAARNCMLSEDMIVRIADFGLSRDIYERDYYSDQDRKTKLPVKWMSPESLEAGVYDHKTDVWSYGVLLWELITRGTAPYAHVDNWDMLNFLKDGRRMQQPYICPDQLYQIMLQCWELDPEKRPTFARLAADVASVITNLEKKNEDERISLNVTYVNCPRASTAVAENQ